MGKDVSTMTFDEIKVELLDKIAGYMTLFSKFDITEETKQRMNEKVSFLINEVSKYNQLRASIREIEKNNIDVDLVDIKDFANLNYECANKEKIISSYLNDDEVLLNYLTSKVQNNGQASIGIQYITDEGNTLYKGINKAITYQVITMMDSMKIINVSYPKELKEYIESNPLQYILTRDEIPYDFTVLFGDELYTNYFNSDGEKFHSDMEERFTNEEIVTISKAVDKCIETNKDDDYNQYVAAITNAKIKNKKTL